MTTFCTYLYKDPKTDVWRYVGKGVSVRPARHLHPKNDTQLSRMLKKRLREGYRVSPVIIPASSDDEACEMERLLIALIGREDLGKGTLFNKTNGGEGTAGRLVKQSEKEKRRRTFETKSCDELNDITARIQDKRNKTTADPLWRQFLAKQISEGKSQRCTVDGINFFDSRKKLIEALGQGTKTGSRSPNFRYV